MSAASFALVRGLWGAELAEELDRTVEGSYLRRVYSRDKLTVRQHHRRALGANRGPFLFSKIRSRGVSPLVDAIRARGES